MSNTDHLIESLSGQVRNSEKPLRLGRMLLLWVVGLGVYIAAIFASGIMPLRPDLIEVLAQKPLFGLEIASLMTLVLSTAWAAVFLGFPDCYQKKSVLRLPLKALGIFTLVLALAWATGSTNAEPGPGVECFLCICGLSFIPAACLFYRLRRMATVQPDIAGMLCSLCAFGLGALILRLSEQTDSIAHVVLWHYAPMLAISALGFCLGPRLLKW